MADSIIFNTPIILAGFGLALVLLVFELRTKSTGFVLPIIASLLSVGVVVYSVLLGASLQEVIIILLVFLLINITMFKSSSDKGDHK